jgi:hypothetical protein
MHVSQDNDVVHTFTPDQSDQPFGETIVPRRSRCGRLVAVCTGKPYPDLSIELN